MWKMSSSVLMGGEETRRAHVNWVSMGFIACLLLLANGGDENGLCDSGLMLSSKVGDELQVG
jgi:hypothetical protein